MRPMVPLTAPGSTGQRLLTELAKVSLRHWGGVPLEYLRDQLGTPHVYAPSLSEILELLALSDLIAIEEWFPWTRADNPSLSIREKRYRINPNIVYEWVDVFTDETDPVPLDL